MKMSQIFKLAVRVLGLVFLYQGVHAVAALLPLLTAPRVRGVMAVKPSWGNYLVIGLFFVVAMWCFFGAAPVQRWAYPEEEKEWE